MSLVFLTYFSYIEKEISFVLFLLYIAIHLIFLFTILYKKFNYAKRIIIISGLIMLLLNFSSAWVFENKFTQDKLLKFKIPVSQEIVKNNSPVYSEGFDIEEVWRIGKKIKELKDIPQEKEIFYLGDNINDKLLENYKVINTYEYQKINHKFTKIYHLERK